MIDIQVAIAAGLCVTCRKYKARFDCDGCGDDHGRYCGHCARPAWVVWIGKILRQRLCPICRMSGDDAMGNWIFDARRFTFEDVQEIMGFT